MKIQVLSLPLVAASLSGAIGGCFFLLIGFEAFLKIALPYVAFGVMIGMIGMALIIFSGLLFWAAFDLP